MKKSVFSLNVLVRSVAVTQVCMYTMRSEVINTTVIRPRACGLHRSMPMLHANAPCQRSCY